MRKKGEMKKWTKFPTELLPAPFREFTEQAADALQCDPAILATALLTAATAAIGNMRRIELKAGWSEPAVLWAAIVADPGQAKSPALKAALGPLQALQEAAVQQFRVQSEEYEAALDEYKKAKYWSKRMPGGNRIPEEPKRPKLTRFIADDATMAALCDVLQDNWRGVLLFRDELAGWLESLSRHSGGGSDASRFLEMHSASSLTIDRKNSPPIFVAKAAVSVIGAIQPMMLKKLLGQRYIENGLAARFIFVQPPPRVAQWSDRTIEQSATDAVEMVFQHLYSIGPDLSPNGEEQPRLIKLSQAAQPVWAEFYDEHQQLATTLPRNLAFAWPKLLAMAARLALVVHFVRWAAGEELAGGTSEIDVHSLQTGLALARWFRDEVSRVYEIMEFGADHEQDEELVDRIKKLGNGGVTARDLTRKFREFRGNPEAAERRLQQLVDQECGRWEFNAPGRAGGRPTSRFVPYGDHGDDET